MTRKSSPAAKPQDPSAPQGGEVPARAPRRKRPA